MEGDITDSSPIYTSYRAHWNSLAVTDSMLESKTIQMVLL
jgi:hypothetical protein